MKCEFFIVLWVYNLHSELTRLVTWAKRNKYSTPLECHQRLLADDEVRIVSYSISLPRLYFFVYLVHSLNGLFFSFPCYRKQGLARHYKFSNLTNMKSRLIVFRK